MNLQFSEDDKLIQDQVDRYLAQHSNIDEVRSVLDGKATYSKAVWEGLAEMGLMGINIPEAYGGIDMSYKTLCLVAQSLGNHAAAIPFSSSVYLATEAILQFGSDAQKSEYLPKLASGKLIGALAVTESIEEITASSIHCSVKSGKLTGTKLAVAAGSIADIAIVLAKNGKAPELYIVDLNASGVERTNIDTVDPTRDTATVTFAGVKADLLGAAGKGWEQLQTIYDRAAVLMAFEQIGGAQAALDMARARK